MFSANSLYADTVRGFEDLLRDQQHGLVLCNTDEATEREPAAPKILIPQNAPDICNSHAVILEFLHLMSRCTLRAVRLCRKTV
jgi:hypothetical protein